MPARHGRGIVLTRHPKRLPVIPGPKWVQGIAGAASGTLGLTLASNTGSGNRLIAVIRANATSASVAASGWTLAATIKSTAPSITIWTKAATGGSDSISAVATGVRLSGAVFEVSNAYSSPIDVSASNTYGTGVTSMVAPTVTPSFLGSLEVAVFLTGGLDSATGGNAVSAPTPVMTPRLSNVDATGHSTLSLYTVPQYLAVATTAETAALTSDIGVALQFSILSGSYSPLAPPALITGGFFAGSY